MADRVRAQGLSELRARKSVKWRLYPSDVLPLPIAEMDFEIADPIKEALHKMVDRSDTGYLGPFPEMFTSFASFAEDRWGWKIEPAHMRIATDVGVGTVEVIRTLIAPADKVMLNSPVYDSIWRWIAELGATLVDAPLEEVEGEYQLNLDLIEREYKAGVKIHILCNPQNPVGVIFDKKSLISLASLAKEYGVVIISDEIHAPLTYKNQSFSPFLSVSDQAREVGIVVTSASKAFNLAGLKCSLIITGSDELKNRINTMPLSVAFRASLFGAEAATVAFNKSRPWLDGVIATLEENKVLVRSLIESKIPTIKYREPNFGYLAWLDLSALKLGDDPAKYLLERGKVAFNAGHLYGPKHKDFIRFNFGTSPEIITEAFDRILKAL